MSNSTENLEQVKYFPDKVVDKLTPQQVQEAEVLLEKVRYYLGKNFPFYSSILFSQNTINAHKTDSGLAWVSLESLNLTFDNISEDEEDLPFGKDSSLFKLLKQGTSGFIKINNLVIHELLHLILNHFYVPKNFNHKIGNIAMDAELHKVMILGGTQKNELPEGAVWPDIKKEGIEFKDQGFCPVPDLENKTWDKIYWDILKFFEDKAKEQNKSLEEAVEAINFLCDVPSGNKGDFETAEARTKIDQLGNIIKSAYIRCKSAGNLPAGMERLVDNFGKSKVPWQEKFRNVLRTKPYPDEIRNKRNNKLAHIPDMPPIMPKFVGERMDAMWLFFDTSGSIQEEDIQEGVNEIHGLRSTSRAELFVASCDTQVYEVKKFEVYDFPQAKDLPIQGGGGTDFRPIFEKVEEYVTKGKCEIPSALVLVTDTFGAFPEKDPGYLTVVLVPSTVHGHWKDYNFHVPEWAELVLIGE